MRLLGGAGVMPWIGSLVKGDLAQKAISLSVLAGAGQIVFVIALPLLSRLYTPADFGAFTIYLSIVNIGGPLVALKFDSAMFATRTRSEALSALALCIATIVAMTVAILVASIVLKTEVPRLSGDSWMLVLIAPAGVFLSGAWSTSSAWAVRADAIHSLAGARFLQPSAMTVMQIAAGLLGFPGTSLIVAHLLSHLGYSTFILARTMTLSEARQVFSTPLRSVIRLARQEIQFPLFVMPAQLSKLAVSNVPPILLAWLFGSEMAGHYGVAFRVIAAPLSIVSLALSNVFTGEASRRREPEDVERVSRWMLVASLIFVAAPILAFGLLAPELAGPLLGPRWLLAGQMASAIAWMGAANALAAPFTEITSIYHFQAIRFTTEVAGLFLVFAPFAIAVVEKLTVMPTVWGLSLGGALGSIVNLIAVWFILRKIRRRESVARAKAAPAAVANQIA